MNIKTCLIIFCSSFALMIISAVIGNILESNGTLSPDAISQRGSVAMKFAYLALFCVMAFSLVPLVMRFFISMQIKIGNGEYFLIKWFHAHEQGVVYGFWIMMFIGFCIIFALAKDDILKNLR